MASSRHDQAPPPRGPIHGRSCTDILCLLLWLVFVVGWAAVAAFVFSHGDPDLLLHPTNSAGEPCGAPGTQVEERPYLSYFDMTRCRAGLDAVVGSGCPTPQVCVAQCPTETYDFTKEHCSPDIRKRYVCRLDIDPTDTSKNCSTLLDDKRCAKVVLKSVPMLDRCIPNILDSDVTSDRKVKDHKSRPTSISVDDLKSGADGAGQFTRLQELGAGAFSDLQNTWWVIVVACVVSALLSLIWIFLMRFITTILIWTAFVGMLGATIYGCVFTYLRYDQVKATSGDDAGFNPLDAFTQGFGSLLDQPTVWLVFFCALCVVAVLLLLLLLVLYKRIRVATAMISQASRAVHSALGTIFFPLVPFVLQLGVVALFLGVALFAASMGDPTYEVVKPGDCGSCPDYTNGSLCTPNGYSDACTDKHLECAGGCVFAGYEPHPAAVYLQIYNVFALFWGLFFCSALGELILAGAFASWYWTFDKRHDLPSLPVLSSAGRAVRYHLGTVAFGSLIIALIRMARTTLQYIQRQTKGVDNALVRGVICCCKCCLWCFEKFMRFINRNAYIVCAIYGTNFCVSAKDAFSLLLRNILRVVVVNSVCNVMLLMGKLMVTALVTIASFYFMEDRIPIDGLDRYVPTTQHSWVPITTAAIASYFVCSVFFSVYTMAVDTIFLCFLEDIEHNDGSPEKPFYMSKSLMQLLGKKNKRDRSRDLTE